MLTIVLHGHGATTIRLAVSIVGIVLAGLGTLIILAQRVMFVLDGSGNLGALTSRDGEAESALVREVDITEGKVFVLFLLGFKLFTHGIDTSIQQSLRLLELLVIIRSVFCP